MTEHARAPTFGGESAYFYFIQKYSHITRFMMRNSLKHGLKEQVKIFVFKLSKPQFKEKTNKMTGKNCKLYETKLQYYIENISEQKHLCVFTFKEPQKIMFDNICMSV